MKVPRTMAATDVHRMNELVVASWNSRGHRVDRLRYLHRLKDECHVIFVQEHWLFDFELHKLTDGLAHTSLIAVSGMNQNEVLVGRPYGGCAILYDDRMNCKSVVITCVSKRLCACILQWPNSVRILLINVYMPFDSGNAQSLHEFKDVLQEVYDIVHSNQDIDRIVFGGDLNCDLQRLGERSRVLREFCVRFSAELCAEHPASRVEYTYRNDATGARSLVDHFVLTENLMANLSGHVTWDEVDNFSDHLPIIARISFDSFLTSGDRSASPRLSWNRANENDTERYRIQVRERLSLLELPHEALMCDGIGCFTHGDAINNYYSQIEQALVTSGQECIPSTRPRGRAGWNELAEPQRRASLFWHHLWEDCGRPRTGWVHELRKKTKAEYKRASKWVVRNQDKLSAERMAERIANGQHQDFWDEVRRTRGSSRDSPTVVDDAVGTEQVCEAFAAKYGELYSSVPYDEEEMRVLQSQIDDAVSSCCAASLCYDDHSILLEDVTWAINKLKSGKADANPGLSSDAFKNAPRELHLHLALLLSCMLRHSCAPDGVLGSILRPIPKNRKKSLNESSNFRSIAISSILLKILDKVVLEKHKNVLRTSDLQFGFKSGHSTTQCTFLLNQVVDHYTQRSGSCYVALLDATKAFDRVHYVRLFQLLLQRGLCPLLAKLLLQMYTLQVLVVGWQGRYSAPFPCKNGIKQGAVLSPVLFCIYMDILLTRLSLSDAGCYYGHLFAGAICYADDLTLLAPTPSAMQALLNICSEFAAEYDVQFNCAKSNVVECGDNRRRQRPVFLLSGATLPHSNNALHLGLLIGPDAPALNIKKACDNFTSKVNMISSIFSHCRVQTLRFLFNSFCTAFYGAPLWSLSDRIFEPFAVAWRKGVRRLLRLSPRTRSKLLPFLIDSIDIKAQIMCRLAGFVCRLRDSCNPLIRMCVSLLPSSSSVFAGNISLLASEIDVEPSALLGSVGHGRLHSDIIESWESTASEDAAISASVLLDLLDTRWARDESFLSREEVSFGVEFLCHQDYG